MTFGGIPAVQWQIPEQFTRMTGVAHKPVIQCKLLYGKKVLEAVIQKQLEQYQPQLLFGHRGDVYETDSHRVNVEGRLGDVIDRSRRLTGISALLRAGIAVGDNVIIRIAISPNPSSMFDQIDSIITGCIEYPLAEK